jgi:hypothetical protein
VVLFVLTTKFAIVFVEYYSVMHNDINHFCG